MFVRIYAVVCLVPTSLDILQKHIPPNLNPVNVRTRLCSLMAFTPGRSRIRTAGTYALRLLSIKLMPGRQVSYARHDGERSETGVVVAVKRVCRTSARSVQRKLIRSPSSGRRSVVRLQIVVTLPLSTCLPIYGRAGFVRVYYSGIRTAVVVDAHCRRLVIITHPP